MLTRRIRIAKEINNQFISILDKQSFLGNRYKTAVVTDIQSFSIPDRFQCRPTIDSFY